MYAKDDGTLVVSASRAGPAGKGCSFLDLGEEKGDGQAGGGTAAVAEVHAKFRGACLLTVPSAPLTDGFEMRCVGSFFWPPPQRRPDGYDGDPQQPCRIGRHFHLVPLVDMPISVYTAELKRLPTAVCSFSGAATGAGHGSLNGPDPSDARVYWLVRALHAMSDREPDPTAGAAISLHAASISALDMSFDRLLSDALLSELCLEAMEAFEPPSAAEDITAASECYEIRLQLQEAVATQVCGISR